jgi:hypothetical protein
VAADNKAKIWAVLGQSGTGKGAWIKARLRKMKPARILILDPQDEYHEFADPVTSARALAEAVIKAGEKGAFRVRYVFPKTCTKEHFDKIFSLACELTYAARNCVFLPEELSNFTTPSWAPPLWKRMCNSGRHEGVHVIGASQFPAQIDKAFLSNATLVHVGFLGEKPHRQAVAQKMDINPDMIRDLPDLAFLEWHREGRKLLLGTVDPVSGRIKERPLDDAVPPTGAKKRA